MRTAVFKRPSSNLTIQTQPDKNQYVVRAPVTINLTASDSAGAPVVADVAVSVYRLDSLQPGEISSLPDYLWLTSELRGTIESPDYYLTQTGPEAAVAADNLMLTQGWRRFRWETADNKARPAGEVPEYRSLVVRGRVTDSRTGAPAKGVLTYVAVPGQVSQLQNQRSDEQGMVRFEMDNFYGPHDVVLQVAPVDSAYQVDMLNPFTETAASTTVPSFSLAEALAGELTARSLSMQVQTSYHDQNRTQPRLPGIDSTAFYSVADERYLLDAYTRFRCWKKF